MPGPDSPAHASPGSGAVPRVTEGDPAKITASSAPYVTRPTRWTLFLRTFVPWQLWRFARINLKMIQIILRSRR